MVIEVQFGVNSDTAGTWPYYCWFMLFSTTTSICIFVLHQANKLGVLTVSALVTVSFCLFQFLCIVFFI